MISSSSFARISAKPWLGGAHYLRGMGALACPALPAKLPGLGHEQQADKPRWKREDDFCGNEDFYGKADFCSKALVGSGDM